MLADNSIIVLSFEKATELLDMYNNIPVGTRFTLTEQELSECSIVEETIDQIVICMPNKQLARSIQGHYIIPFNNVHLNKGDKNKKAVDPFLLWKSKCSARHSGVRYLELENIINAYFFTLDERRVYIGSFNKKELTGKMFNA